MRCAALLMLLPLLAGCNVHSKNPANGDENVSIHADESGHIEFNLPVAEGKLKVPAAMMHNGDFDIDGVKLMPGSAVTGFSVLAGDKGANVTDGVQGARIGGRSALLLRRPVRGSRASRRRCPGTRSPARRRTEARSRST